VFLVDRYGTKLNSGGYDYSFTLALELYVWLIVIRLNFFILLYFIKQCPWLEKI
jgi:hypothetical protein